MKLMALVLTLGLSFDSALAESNFKYHVIEKALPGTQNIEYTVIKEDLTLRADQTRLSQDVIYTKIAPPKSFNLLKEALAADNDKAIAFQETTRAGKSLWTPIKNTWNAQDEIDFQNWFIQNASTQLATIAGLNMDCADLGLLFRWAFAHDRKLPVANTLISGKLFGHFSSSSSWDSLPTHADWKQDQRFKAAIKYLFSNTYTRSVYDDLYPTLINPTYVHPGSIYMIIQASTGRTQNIYKINSAEIRTLWGNSPPSKKIYESAIMWDPAVKNRFGSWRWPAYTNGAWKLVAGSQMPGYSEEQYTQRKNLGETAFRTWVINRLNSR